MSIWFLLSLVKFDSVGLKRIRKKKVSLTLITKQQILDSSKLKEFANNNFKFHENGRNFSKRAENTVGKNTK